ncbi:MAG: T9SS type A sorting domain-containing protein, partial [Hymenobacter sp.]
VSVPQLGTYDLNNTSALTITGAQLQGLLGSSNTNVSATRLQYRVYLVGTAPASIPAYSEVVLTSSQSGTSSGSLFYGSGSTSVDVLADLRSGGTYVLAIRFQVDVNNGSAASTTTFSDLSNGDFFYANFSITAPPVTPTGGTTIWQSTSSTDWAVAANWSNGVPTATSNAVIPEKTSSNNLAYPILNDSTYRYAVKNLTLEGNSASTVGLLNVGIATLRIYGDLSGAAGIGANQTNASGVINRAQNSTIIFAGENDQTITSQLVASDIIIAGSGVKSVVGTMNPTNIIAFRPTSVANGVRVQSAVYTNNSLTPVYNTLGSSYIQISATSRISTVPGEAETNSSYITGVTRSDRSLLPGVTNTFGNLGLDVTANHTASSVYVYRVIGDPLFGPTSNSTAHPTRRYYRITGDDNSSSSAFASSTIDVVFHYLDSVYERYDIDEQNLIMYRTVTQGTPYETLVGVLDQTANTVTHTALSSLSDVKYTLGDKTNPLPVTLVSFLAVRNGATAQLTWVTASEKNNQGFEVQVSADGATFRTLAFVASQASNSTQKLAYTYADIEAGKTGVRYYRLHQIDLNGSDSYSPVRVVGFEGGTLATEVNVYPNPVAGSEARLLIQTAEAGPAHLRITDLLGRTLIDQTVTTASGSTETSLTELINAKPGTYLAQLTLPSGQVKTLKVQKQ